MRALQSKPPQKPTLRSVLSRVRSAETFQSTPSSAILPGTASPTQRTASAAPFNNPAPLSYPAPFSSPPSFSSPP